MRTTSQIRSNSNRTIFTTIEQNQLYYQLHVAILLSCSWIFKRLSVNLRTA
jgi:hypothetical protein